MISDHSPPIVKAVSRRFRCLIFKVNPRFCSRNMMLLPFNLRSFPLFQPMRLLCQLIIGHDPSGLNMILSQPIHESKLDQQLTQPRDDVPPPPVFTGLCGGAAGVCRKEDKEDQRPELTTSQSQTKVQPPKGHSYLVVGASQILHLTYIYIYVMYTLVDESTTLHILWELICDEIVTIYLRTTRLYNKYTIHIHNAT